MKQNNIIDSDKLSIILGPPGTGKTTYLINIIDNLLSGGFLSKKIGFISFAKKTIIEVCDRMEEKYSLLYEDLPYFRTIHSLCFRLLGLSSKQIMQKEHYEEMGGILGLEFQRDDEEEEEEEGNIKFMSVLNEYIHLENLARNRMITLKEQWGEVDNIQLSWGELKAYSNLLKKYKAENNLYDFTDMLENFLKDDCMLYLTHLFIDEAQDLSRLQWAVIYKLSNFTDNIYIAGDDDQTIFAWNGADKETFMSLKGDTQILKKSYRLPKKVLDLSLKTIKRVKKRLEKNYTDNGQEGAVIYHNDISSVPLHSGEWFILARNKHLYKPFEEICMLSGYPYMTMSGRLSVLQTDAIRAIISWDALQKGEFVLLKHIKILYKYLERNEGIRAGIKKLGDSSPKTLFNLSTLREEYYLNASGDWYEALKKMPCEFKNYIRLLQKRKENFIKPRITMSTIHSTKGGERDNVLVITDMSKRTYDGYTSSEDDETRVFYVAMTRAKENLHILSPQTERFFYM